MTAVETLVLAASGSLVWSILLKVTATTVLALALVRLARRRQAAFRHVLLAAAFAVLIVLPVAAAVAPAIRVAVPVAAHQAAATADVEPVIDAARIGVLGRPGGRGRAVSALDVLRVIVHDPAGRLDCRRDDVRAARRHWAVAGACASPIGAALAARPGDRRAAGAGSRSSPAGGRAAARVRARADDLRRDPSHDRPADRCARVDERRPCPRAHARD